MSNRQFQKGTWRIFVNCTAAIQFVKNILYLDSVMNFISVKFEFGVIIYRPSWNILLEKFIFYVDESLKVVVIHGLDFIL